MTISVRMNVVAFTGRLVPIYEVIGNLDGTPIFLGRMVRNDRIGGVNTSHQEGALPDRTWTWIPSEEKAVRRMVEHKSL